jgi:hypothetical protein
VSAETSNLQLLAALYPRLYHVATGGAWSSIAELGLMSANRLAERADVESERHERFLRHRRAHAEEVRLRGGGSALLRDQSPLHASKLAPALQDGTSVADWLELLNGYVFLWPTRQRVETFLAAYRDEEHDVIVVDTAQLLQRHATRTRLSHMNTGATSPFAHPRGRDTFRDLVCYPLADRRRSYGAARAVAEVVVEGEIPDIREMVVFVRRYRGTRFERDVWARAPGTAHAV